MASSRLQTQRRATIPITQICSRSVHRERRCQEEQEECHGMTAVPKFGQDRSIGSAVAKETPVAREKQRP